MRVKITFEADDDLRRAINTYYRQEPELATRQQLWTFFRNHGESMNSDVAYEAQAKLENEQCHASE